MKKFSVIVLLLVSLLTWGCTEEPVEEPISTDKQEVEEDATKRIGPYPGFYAPDFTLGDVYGTQEVSLSDYEGKAVMLVFWTTSCGYCRAELPELNEVKDQLEDRPIEILAVNITVSDVYEEVLGFTNQKGLRYPVLLDRTGELTQEYLVRNVPTNIFITSEGKISAYRLGKMDVDDIVKELEKAIVE